jgi:NADH dehydrogenase
VVWGTLGWLAWLALHLLYLVGYRNKIIVFVNWSWRYLSWGSGPRVIVGEDVDEDVNEGGEELGAGGPGGD